MATLPPVSDPLQYFGDSFSYRDSSLPAVSFLESMPSVTVEWPFEIAQEKFRKELNVENIKMENLDHIYRILQSTRSNNRRDILTLNSDSINLARAKIEHKMTLLHILLYKLLKTYDPIKKQELHDKIIEILQLIPRDDLTHCFTAQSFSGFSVMHLAAANWNEDFNLLKEFLEMLPIEDRSDCLKIQGGLHSFTPLHLAAYRVVRALTSLPLFKASCRKTYALIKLGLPFNDHSPLTISHQQLKPILDLIPDDEKESVEKIKDLFNRTYNNLIEERIFPPKKYYRTNHVWSGNIPLAANCPGRLRDMRLKNAERPTRKVNSINIAERSKPRKGIWTDSEEDSPYSSSSEIFEESTNSINNIALYYLVREEIQI